MRLATFAPPGAEPRAGEVRGDTVVSFDDATTVLDRLTTGDRTPARGASYALSDVTLLAPVPHPRAIFGVGRNYAAHVAEMSHDAPPAVPLIFMKTPHSATGPNGTVAQPAVVSALDYEGELAVVIGAGGAVAGYAVADDVTARDLQRSEEQWTRAKGADAFCPYGPWITTADEVSDPEALRLRTWVNGELRQDASTGDLIFGIDHLVAFLTETNSLHPGDLILTGTPSGVGAAMDPPALLRDGDVVRIEIEELGAIEHRIMAAP